MAGERRDGLKRQSRGKDLNNDGEVKPVHVSVTRWSRLNRVYAENSENSETNVYWNSFSPPQRNLRGGEYEIPSQSQSSQSSGSSASQPSSQNALNQVSPSVLLGTVNKRTPPVCVIKRKPRTTKSMVRHDSSEELKNKFSGLFTSGAKRTKKTAILENPSRSGEETVQSSGKKVVPASVRACGDTLNEFPEDDMDDDWDKAMIEASQAVEEAYVNNNNKAAKSKSKSNSAPEIQNTPKRVSARIATRGFPKSLSAGQSGDTQLTFSCNDLDQDQGDISIFESSTINSPESDKSSRTSKTNTKNDSSNSSSTCTKLEKSKLSDSNSNECEWDDDFDHLFSQIPLP